MPDLELAARWLLLYLAPGLGNRRLSQLQQAYSDPAAMLEAALAQHVKLPAETLQWLKSPDHARIEAHLKWCQQPRHHMLVLGDNDYPQLLADINNAPIILFVVGNLEYLWRPQIALVGSRNPSHTGLSLTTEMTAQLATAGLVITSGLAEGIDAAAHTAALEHQQPTIAVLGTGVDRVYPAINKQLAQRIAAQGALVSEFALGAEARPGHFPARNRIISGLSIATLVIEAGLRSGSLITARLAAEQGRETLAVPGSVRNATSRGCHALIRDGAQLVENASQVLEEIAPQAGRMAAGLTNTMQTAENTKREQAIEQVTGSHNNDFITADFDEDYWQLWKALDGDSLTLDELVEVTDLTPEAISSMLLMLELRGHVALEAGGNWTRIHEVG